MEIRELAGKLKKSGMSLDSAILVSEMVDAQEDRQELITWMDKNPGASVPEILKKARSIMGASLDRRFPVK